MHSIPTLPPILGGGRHSAAPRWTCFQSESDRAALCVTIRDRCVTPPENDIGVHRRSVHTACHVSDRGCAGSNFQHLSFNNVARALALTQLYLDIWLNKIVPKASSLCHKTHSNYGPPRSAASPYSAALVRRRENVFNVLLCTLNVGRHRGPSIHDDEV